MKRQRMALVGEARPYVGASPDAVRAGAWFADSADGKQPLPEWVPYWDVSHKLRAKRRIEVDVGRALADASLSTDCRLALSVVLASEFEDEGCRATIDASDGLIPLDLEVILDGPSLGTAVMLLTSLVLAEPAARVEGPVAWRRGSILWQDSKKVRLYGESSQFPVMEVDFADFGLHPASPWFVQIGPDLGLPAMGSILLLLNERFPLVTEAARDMSAERPELAAVRSALFADVGRVLVEFALSQDNLADEWPEESLGAVLATVVQSRFPQSLDELRTLRKNDPSQWAATVQATLGLFREPLR
jgi:hypothetical protein